jgi:hypothetical protein
MDNGAMGKESHNMNTFEVLVISVWLLIVVLGGLIAHYKRDYVSRGMAICFFTSIFGIFALLFSPPSKARLGGRQDEHNWPPQAWLAVAGTLLVVLVVLLAGRLGSGGQ